MESEGQHEYSISELAEEAGVSTRTIRYYVSEGLLPPPVGSGPNSRYTNAHRDQLEIIGRLKAQYLPLREIRRRLIGHGAPDASIAPAAAPASSPGPDWLRSPLRKRHELHEQRVNLSMPSPESAHLTTGAKEPARHAYAMPPPAEPDPAGAAWRRVSISDEAELLITESQYRRHQDKIDWLVQWARRVLEA